MYLPTMATDPDVLILQGEIAVGLRCVECLARFTKQHNHARTICKGCAVRVVQEQGYEIARYAEEDVEGYKSRARARRENA